MVADRCQLINEYINEKKKKIFKKIQQKTKKIKQKQKQKNKTTTT